MRWLVGGRTLHGEAVEVGAGMGMGAGVEGVGVMGVGVMGVMGVGYLCSKQPLATLTHVNSRIEG